MDLKVAEERFQALPGLRQAALEFDTAVNRALQDTQTANVSRDATSEHADSVWLLLPEVDTAKELSHQLQAFGHKVESFVDIDSCLARLQTGAPALLLATVQQADGQLLFDQSLLLKQLQQSGSRLLLLSVQDDFDIRIQAAQHRADGFFVAPFDATSITSMVSELLELGGKQTGRVCIVDDDLLLAQHYALVLNSTGIETHIVQNVRNIISEILSFQPDLLLMDMYMPDYSGAELAGVIRQYAFLKRLPIVFLSSEINKTLQLSAMASGADDFLTKPIDDTQLVQTIKTRLKRSLQLKNLIEKDSLTALIKHSAIKDVAELEFERSQRYSKAFSIVMLDIDHFKAVNDNYGHATGDNVITALAMLLRKRIRKTDRAGRYGGEEFMLVLPECTHEQATKLAEQILALFRGLHFTSGDVTFSCSFSAGVACSADAAYENAEQMIEAADAALYNAKRNGRNQIC